jgi:hypothetical protein
MLPEFVPTAPSRATAAETGTRASTTSQEATVPRGSDGSRISPNGTRCSRLRLAFDGPGQMISSALFMAVGRSTSAGLFRCCVEPYGSLRESRSDKKTLPEMVIVCDSCYLLAMFEIRKSIPLALHDKAYQLCYECGSQCRRPTLQVGVTVISVC